MHLCFFSPARRRRSNPFLPSPVRAGGRLACAGVLMAVLGGCYVVPAYPPPAAGAALPTALASAPLTMTARLYPANDAAAASGTVVASVTSDHHGRGSFSVVIEGERFQGEATRLAGGSREGLANGTGQRGNYLSCRYSMSSPQRGTGQCKLSNGALFAMHIGE